MIVMVTTIITVPVCDRELLFVQEILPSCMALFPAVAVVVVSRFRVDTNFAILDFGYLLFHYLASE